MSTVGNSLRIPNYITAQTAQGLRQLMLNNNLKYGMQFSYFDIQFVNGKWYVWYFDLESTDRLVEGIKKKGG